MDVLSNGLVDIRLLCKYPEIRGVCPLCGYPPLICLIPAIEVAEDLRRYILEIYDDFLSPDGTVRW